MVVINKDFYTEIILLAKEIERNKKNEHTYHG